MALVWPKTTINRGVASQQPRLTLGVEQVVWIEADRGPYDKAYRFTTKGALRAMFGDRPTGARGYPFLAAEIALDSGCVLWVARAMHYTDPTDASTVTATASTVDVNDRVTPTPATKLTFDAVELGTAGDQIQVVIAAGTAANTVKITITDLHGNLTEEVYDNVSVDTDSAKYVETVINGVSAMVIVTDADPTATPVLPDDLPATGTYTLASGSNGTAINSASVIGDSTAGTGIYAANNALAKLETRFAHMCLDSADAVRAALATWAQTAKIRATIEPPDSTDWSDAVDWRNAEGDYTGEALLDNAYVSFLYGRPIVYDVVAAANVAVPVFAALAPAIVNSTNEKTGGGSWQPVAGDPNGLVSSLVLGVSDDVGPKAREDAQDALAAAGFNVLATIDGTLQFWGNFTALLDDTSMLSRAHVVDFLNEFERLLGPVYNKTHFKINRPDTWKAAWLKAKKVLEKYVGKAFFVPTGYSLADLYIGDIDVVDPSNAEQYTPDGPNTPESVAAGEYNVTIILPVFSAVDQGIGVNVQVTNSATDFSVVLPS